MALSATLTADFSSFIQAAKDGGAALQEFRATATSAGGVLDTMVDGFDTAPAVAETRQLTAALDIVTTTATATAPALAQVGDATGAAAGQADSFRDAFGQVDKSLASVGISLGPLPAMFDELAAMAGKSVTELGLLGTAGAVLAAGMAGWKVGTMIGEFTGLTDWISRSTAAAMGWGDVAGQEAAVASDNLARASALAGREITDMAQAVNILNTAAAAATVEQKKLAADLKLSEEAAEKFGSFVAKLFGYDDINRAEMYRAALGGVQNVTKLTTDAKKELHAAVTDAIEAYTALGQKAPAELVAIQQATTELIKITTSFSAANSGAWTQFAATVEEGSARIARFIEQSKLGWEDIGGVSKAMLEQIAKDAEEKYAVALQHADHFTGKQIADFRTAATEARAAVESWGTATLEAYDAIAAASTDTANVQIADAQRAAAATTLSWSEAMAEVQRGQGTMGGTVGGAVDLSGANRAAMQKAWEEHRYFGPVANVSEANPRGTGPDFAALGYRAAGGPVSAGAPYMVGERGPELFVPRESGSIRAHGAAGVTVNNAITVTGGGTEELARKVADAIMRTVRAGTQLGTA